MQDGIIWWDLTYYTNHLLSIFMAQKLIITTIVNTPYSYSSELLFKEFKTIKLKLLYFYRAELQMYKYDMLYMFKMGLLGMGIITL